MTADVADFHSGQGQWYVAVAAPVIGKQEDYLPLPSPVFILFALRRRGGSSNFTARQYFFGYEILVADVQKIHFPHLSLAWIFRSDNSC